MLTAIGLTVLFAPSALVVLVAVLLPKAKPYKSQGMRYPKVH